ncbi:MAG: hypothetical protein ACYDHH_05010 [Solirubrobacteraceae bacterium]
MSGRRSLCTALALAAVWITALPASAGAAPPRLKRSATGATGTTAPVAPPPEFTVSSINSPPNDAELFFNGDTGSGRLVLRGNVAGQTPTAKGDLYCYSAAYATATKLATAIDVSSGIFAADISLGPIAGQACKLAIVPSGTVPSGAAALAPYAGPVVSVSEQFTHSTDGNTYSYYVLSGQLQWSFALQSLGDCPIIASYGTDPTTLGSYSLFDGDACLPAQSGISPGLNSRSALQVDGLNAYPPGAISALAGEGGFEPLSYAATYASYLYNGATIQETDIPTVCAPPGGYPPTPAVCPTLHDAGITVQQTTTIVPGGQVARVTQRYASADGRPHTVDLLLSQSIQAPGANEVPGFQFPRQSQFAAHAAPDSFTLFAPGPGSILVVGDSVAAPSTANPAGAITYSAAPKAADFITPPNSTVTTMLLHYVVNLGARGSSSFTWSYSQSDSAAGLQSLEAAQRDRYFHPGVRVLAPRAALRTSRRTVTVRGRVSDAVGIKSVTVDGKQSLLGSTNTYRHKVTLRRGINVIKIVVTNFGGHVVRAQRRVNYVPPPRLRGRGSGRSRPR